MLVDKIAAIAVVTVTFLNEVVTSFCFIRLVILHIDLEFLWTMCELAFIGIRAI